MNFNIFSSLFDFLRILLYQFIVCIMVGHAFCFTYPPLLFAQETDPMSMNIESLMGIEVTSVSKKPQSLSHSAAAIYVITSEDIRRSGVTTIADALRMVPGVNVGRINSSQWAVTARGLNGRYADKLLVLMDGRSLYTPLFSGVFWEVQDTMIEDIERIEVIRGPGATIWGADAVNGVINIITKHTADTLGGLAVAGGGSYERTFGRARYGTVLGEGIFGRIYAKADDRDSFVRADNGSNAGDDWKIMRTGFRVDGTPDADHSFTMQGDLYSGDIDQQIILPTLASPYSMTVDEDGEVAGGNFQASWEKIFFSDSGFSIKAYYDRAERKEVYLHEETDMAEVELRHRFSPFERHDVVWGLQYRYIEDLKHDSYYIDFEDNTRDSNLYGFFLQDEITLLQDQLYLTLGSKLEHNDYSGYEVQPSIRCMWHLYERHNLWASISRAVRTPSDVEQNVTGIKAFVYPPYSGLNFLPLPAVAGVKGNQAFDSQEVIAHEMGWRMLITKDISLDTALFYNKYDALRTFWYRLAEENAFFYPDHVEMYGIATNEGEGSVHGAELAVACQPTDKLKVDVAYSWIQDKFINSEMMNINESPAHQFSVHGSWRATEDITLDLWLRYVDETIWIYTPGTSNDTLFENAAFRYNADSYLTCDFQMEWHLMENLSLSLVGQNLLDSGHVEATQDYYTPPTEIERGVYAKVTYGF